MQPKALAKSAMLDRGPLVRNLGRAWGLVLALQRFEAYQRPRYAALHAEPADHPEPLQRLKMLDLALRVRAEKDTLGDVGSERYLVATRSLRDRGN